MTTYTNITKPSSTPYTDSHPQGKEQYDESTLTYDSDSTFYDGTNTGLYTNVSKPSSTSYTNITKPS